MEGAEKLDLARFHEVVSSNLNGPLPISIGLADEWVAEISNVSSFQGEYKSFKMHYLAWSALRSSVVLSQMGLAAHVAAVQRQALEGIVYGNLFMIDDEFHELWKKRETCSMSKSRFRREGFGRGIKLIGLFDANLADEIKAKYDELIDLGAHPNPQVMEVISTFRVDEVVGEGEVKLAMVCGRNEIDMFQFYNVSIYQMLMNSLGHLFPERANAPALKKLRHRVNVESLNFIHVLTERFDKLSV